MSKHYVIPAHERAGLSRLEAAEMIGVSPTLFDQLVRDGIMPPPKKIGRRRVWKRQDVEKWFDDLPYAGVDEQNTEPEASSEWTVA
jgi:predicted DNA-binding transcriptional regulator AlpA